MWVIRVVLDIFKTAIGSFDAIWDYCNIKCITQWCSGSGFLESDPAEL